MRILASADIHGSCGLSVARRAIQIRQWLILAWDLFDADFEDQQRQQAQFIVAILREAQAPVLYIMGNNDNVTSRLRGRVDPSLCTGAA